MAGQQDFEGGLSQGSSVMEDNSYLTRFANTGYPAAQFINELASVGVPINQLLCTAGLAPIPAVVIASLLGGACGANTFFTAGHYQGARMGVSRDVNDVAQRPTAIGAYAMLRISMWLTVGQWWMNTLFIYLETKQSWFKNNSLTWQEALSVSSVYFICQSLFDLLSDSVESAQEYIARRNYANLTSSFDLLPAGCLRAIMCCNFAKNWVRGAGSFLQTVTRLMPLLVWGFQYLSRETALAINIPVGFIIGIIIFTQKYYFAGKSVEDNIAKLRGYGTIDDKSTKALPYLVGTALYYTLYLAGPLEGIDAFLGPFAYITLICQLANASSSTMLGLAIGMAGVAAFFVGLGTDRSERREAQKEAVKDTQNRTASCWYSLFGGSGAAVTGAAESADTHLLAQA